MLKRGKNKSIDHNRFSIIKNNFVIPYFILLYFIVALIQ